MFDIQSIKKKINQVNISEVLFIGLLNLVLMSFMVMPLPAILGVFLLQLPFFILIKEKKHFVYYSIGYFFANLVIGFCISMIYRSIIVGVISLVILSFNHFYAKNKTEEKYRELIFGVLMPFFVLFVVEYMQKNVIDTCKNLFLAYNQPDSSFGFHLALCITILFIWSLYFLMTLFFKKKYTAILFTTVPLFLLGIINMVVLYLTLSPLLPSDIFIFQTAMDVIEEQKISLDLALLIFSSLLLICLFLYIAKRVYKDTVVNKTKRMVQGLISTFCIIILYLSIGNIETLNFNANYRYGFLYNFIREIQSDLPVPDGYVPMDIETTLSDNVMTMKENPNVIIVMSEAFSDLTKVYGTETSEDPIPYFHELQSNYPSGVVYSSVFGNNTVSSEFECLTGISTGFTTKGSNVYQRFMKDNFYSLGEYYSTLGYKTGVFHACAGNNYNRIKAYEMMNYDESIFLEDLPKDTETIRTFVSDKANFEKVTGLINETEEPLFLMNITMQNHASYDKDFEIEPYISLTNGNEEYKDVERYLSLLKKSDDDLKEFLDELSNSAEPTMVLFFGDHQPMVSREFYSDQIGTEFTEFSLEEKAETYQVPYLLWANYDMETSFKAPQITSMNYLSLLLNSYIGNPDTEWFSILRELQQYYPVITENFVIDSEGTITSMEDIKEILKEENLDISTALLKRYQFACYSFFAD